jgi:AAA domain
MHVALGREYRGRRVKQGSVVYVACEGERGLGARVEAWRQANPLDTSISVPFWLLPTRLRLASEHKATVITEVEYMKDGEAGAAVTSKLKTIELGQDEDGELITSCVIEPADQEPEAPKDNSKSSKPLPPSEQIALDCLDKALRNDGTNITIAGEFKRRAVTVEAWRKWFYSTGKP